MPLLLVKVNNYNTSKLMKRFENVYRFIDKGVIEMTEVTTKDSFWCIFLLLFLDLESRFILHLLSHLIFTANSRDG